MTWRHLAVRNIRHRAGTYTSFFLSSTLAVAMFFLYAAGVDHPAFSGNSGMGAVRTALGAVEVLVAVFAILFIGYAHGAFLKARQRELAVLNLIGLTPAQLGKMIHWENAIIGGASLAVGLGSGLTLARLFFLAMGKALDLDVPVSFYWPVRAMAVTAATFTLIFGLLSWRGYRRLSRWPVAELLRGAARGNKPPRVSAWLAMACFLTLGSSYVLVLWPGPRPALLRDMMQSGAYTWAVLALLAVGTYLFFSEAGGAVLAAFKVRPAVYYRGANLITVSQLLYRARDNVKILFMVSLLSTMAFTAVGWFTRTYQVVEKRAIEETPVGVQMMGMPGGLSPERVEAILSEHGLPAGAHAQFRVLRAKIAAQANAYVYLMPLSEVNRWIGTLTAAKELTVGPGQATLLVSPAYPWNPMLGAWNLDLGQGPLAVIVTGRVVTGGIFARWLGISGQVVMEDSVFERLWQTYGATRGLVANGWDLPAWRSRAAREAAGQLVIEGQATRFSQGPETVYSRPIAYSNLKAGAGMALVLAGFLSVLFFLASGSMIYFKLYTDVQEERSQFQTMIKLGLDVSEIRQVVSVQTAILFFTPVVFAVVHGTLALAAMTGDTGRSLWLPAGLTGAVFAFLYIGYFLATRGSYVRAVMEG